MRYGKRAARSPGKSAHGPTRSSRPSDRREVHAGGRATERGFRITTPATALAQAIRNPFSFDRAARTRHRRARQEFRAHLRRGDRPGGPSYAYPATFPANLR
jgi:hypothetical protein